MVDKHTRSPWVAIRDKNVIRIWPPDPFKRTGLLAGTPLEGVKIVAPRNGAKTGEKITHGAFRQEQLGNAALIASAPELLEACRLMVWALKEIGGGRGLVAGHGDALDAGLLAIQKAETMPRNA